MTDGGTRDGKERIDWLVLIVAVFFIAAFAFCVIAHAFGFYPGITGPCIVVSVFGMVGAVLWAHFRGDQ